MKPNWNNVTLAGQIEIGMAKGDESLARAGISKQVDIEDQIPVLQQSLQDAIARGKELEGYIAALLAKKREMNSALRDFLAARAAAQSPAASVANGPSQGSPQDSTQSKVDLACSDFERVLP